jgi:hypothetical protein
MRISNVHVFVAPNFGVKHALQHALKRSLQLPINNQLTLTLYEVVDHYKRTTIMFNAEYEVGEQGSKTMKKIAGTTFLHIELDKSGEFVIPAIDIDYEEVA